MSKEIKKKEAALPAEVADWGQEQASGSSQDIEIPKLLLMQFMSDKVKEKKAEFGEFRDTADNKMLGNLETTFEVIPVAMEKKWVEFDIQVAKNGSTKRTFRQTVMINDNPTSPGYNDELPRNEPGLERDRVMDFYVLLPDELKDGTAIPYVVSFRRTALRAGKQLYTQMFVRNRAAKKAPAAVVMNLGSYSKENDDGEFAVPELSVSRATTSKELVDAYNWYLLIKGGKTQLDDSDLGVSEKDKAVGGDY